MAAEPGSSHNESRAVAAAHSRDALQVVLCLASVPSYRRALLTCLQDLHPRLQVLAGDHFFDATLRTDLSLAEGITAVRNRYALGRRLLLQTGGLRRAIAADVAILELNPRIANTWLVALVRRALRRPTCMWGHAWPRAGRQARSEPLRQPLRRLADVLIVYTDSEARALQERIPSVPVVAAPNSLYRRAEMQPAEPVGPVQDVIYSGRLVPEKRPGTLVQAFAIAAAELPLGARLHIVGDGPERQALQRAVVEHGLEHRVVFHGHVDDPQRLRGLYAGALLSTSPGYVGLSATQSFAFGVPMLLADDEPHAPEVEAVRPGENAVYFAARDVQAMAAAMVEVYARGEWWLGQRQQIARACAATYSGEAMAERFTEAIALARARRARAPRKWRARRTR